MAICERGPGLKLSPHNVSILNTEFYGLKYIVGALFLIIIIL